jgi:long-chain acyl-CoA synthetase
MEVQTAATPSALATGSKTLADLVLLASKKHAKLTAQRFKLGDEWLDISFEELGTIVREVSLGLESIGIEPGDRVAILAHTRPEWTHSDFGILCLGATVVPVYQTNSPEECQYVIDHSESRGVIVEDAGQLAKIREIRDQLPRLEHVISIEPVDADDVISLDELRERGRGGSQEDFEQNVAAVERSTVASYIYTSGTTGPPKGCIIDHANWRDMLDMLQREEDVLVESEVAYLFLPLAHAFARLIELGAIDVGATIAYWERDPQRIIPNLVEVQPTYFPSVPRIFEKIYALAVASAPDKELMDKAVELGVQVRDARRRGEQIPADLQAAFELADEEMYSKVRDLFGGQIKSAVTGAAPIAPEILEFFYACGVLVMEGWGMTETSTAATINRRHDFKFGSVGKPFPGVDVRIAADGEILVRGANIFRGYYKNPEATSTTIVDSWLHTGDLGRIDEDGFVYITGRKKDIIITAGGKNITPANLENWLKQNQYISQAVVYGDRRPYLTALITLDPEELTAWAEERNIEETDPVELSKRDEVRAMVQETVDGVNSRVGPVEQLKYFTILPHDLSQETGELTPTLKVKRKVVYEKYADVLDEMYPLADRGPADGRA